MTSVATTTLAAPFVHSMRRQHLNSWAHHVLRWTPPVGGAFLIAGGLAWLAIGFFATADFSGIAPYSTTLAVVFLSFLPLIAAAYYCYRQRAEQIRCRRAQETAEQLARESNTDRVVAEALLRESEQRLRWLSEGMQNYAVITLDPDGRIVGWDKTATTIYGYAESEIVGRSVFSLCMEEDVSGGKAGQELQRALIGGGYEERCWRVRRGGWKFWARVVLTPMRQENGELRGLLCLTQDISEYRQTEEALRSSRTLYRNLTETARDIVITFAKDGSITSLNLAFDKTTGWNRADWVGQPLTSLAHPEDVARMQELVQCLVGGDSTPVVELRIRLANGEHLAVEWMTTPQVKDGEVIGGLALVRDLTDRNNAEESLRATEEKLRQAQKMEAVGRLAGGIAHDFNNLLTVILGNADLFLMTCQDDRLRVYATEISKAGDRAATLTRQLLAFSRKSVMQTRVLNLNDQVGNLDKMLKHLIGEDIDFTARLHSEPLHVKADPSQIEQVIMNLVVNARDAMPEGGALTLETSTARLDPKTKAPTANGAGQPYATLTVADTGVGMDDQVKNHLFEPFFTTKEQGKGTGLGLAMVYGIVQQSDGHIEVVSAPSQGTTFKIYLPLATAMEKPNQRRERRQQRPMPGTETILLAEDEEGVRLFAANALRLNGYTVLEAADGAKALTLCESFEGAIHLLLTDVVMPSVGGVELARQVSQLHPHIKVMFMSGYPDRQLADGAPERAGRYIQKPFAAQDLTARVRRLLDARVEEPVRV